MSTIIRSAQTRDSPHIVELARSLVEFHVGLDPIRFVCPEPRQTYADWLATLILSDRALVLVAEGADGPAPPCAYLLAEHVSAQAHFWSPSAVWVHDVFVSPDARGAEIATRLLSRATDWARARGVSQLRVLCAHANPTARAFFESKGLRPTAAELALDL